ncbi:calcium/proton exchanger [Singulisphaera sp. Ch08]|uniref:Ca(2+)/H(+) antiporter n=1 Tax=Singulisphaera sp. Ch08 TaxID=3120278 RepID=A0AAU7CI35_9BACT
MFVKWSLLLVPVSLFLAHVVHASPTWIFATAVLAIIPLAEWIRRATEQIGHRAGPAVGGLLSVTFGNLAELVIALFVLAEGHQQVVKAQITGSIIGNGLLGLGIAILIGTWGREHQKFKRESAGQLSNMLILTLIALLLPAFFDLAEQGTTAPALRQQRDLQLSLGVAVVLIAVYIAYLIFTLYTHRLIFATEKSSEEAHWSLGKALAILLGGTVVLTIEAELVSSALEATATSLGVTTFFLGITVLAVVGNAAEYLTAAYYAHRNQMGVALQITVGATIQVALLIAPLLVLISYFMGHPMDLVFSNPLELIAVAGVALSVTVISLDGETNWLEGLLLVAVYLLLSLAFYFVTPDMSPLPLVTPH